jgi:hypothetical protein
MVSRARCSWPAAYCRPPTTTEPRCCVRCSRPWRCIWGASLPMGHGPSVRRSPKPDPRCRTNCVTFITCTKQPSQSMRLTAMRRRFSQNTSVACAPSNGGSQDGAIVKRRWSGATAPPAGVPAPTMVARLWRRPGSNSTLASTPWPRVSSGWKNGGLAQSPRAPEDDPAARAGRDSVAVARGAGGLWLGASRRAPPEP